MVSSELKESDIPADQATVPDEKRTMFYLKQRDIQINLLVMTYMWGTVSFTYYLISFQLKYLPGDVYNNSMASSASELLAYILGGILYKKIGIRLAFCFSYLISVVGGAMILFWGTNNP